MARATRRTVNPERCYIILNFGLTSRQMPDDHSLPRKDIRWRQLLPAARRRAGDVAQPSLCAM